MATSKITTDSIQDNTITSQNIQDNTISDSKLASTLDLTGKSISMTDLNLDAGFGSKAPIYGVRAWVNFDGTTNTGGNCTIRGSANVSSVADNGTGDYTINFTSAMPDANYALVGNAGLGSPNGTQYVVEIDSRGQGLTATEANINTGVAGSGATTGDDASIVTVMFIR